MPDQLSQNQVHPLPKLALLNEIGHLVISSTDLNDLFREAAELLRVRLGLQYVMVGTIDYEKREILTRATAGFEPDPSVLCAGQGIQEGIIGEATESGKTVVINDVSKHARYVRGIPTTQSEICVPLKYLDRVVGFLNIESDRLGAFEQFDIELLEAVGSFLGQAVRNAQLRGELEESKNYLESVVQYAGDAIITFDREGKILTWNNAAERILGQPREKVLHRNVRDLIHGPSEMLQGIYQRIMAGEIVRGLQMRYTSQDEITRTLDLSMAPVLDRQGSVGGVSCILRDITEKIEAEAELQRNLQAMQLLNEVSVELTSILDLDKLLDQIAQIIRGFIDYELFAILLVDEEKSEFIWKTSIGYSEESYHELQRLGIREGVVGRVVRSRSATILDDVKGDPDYKPVRTRSGKDPQSEMVVPLITKDRIVGVLVLESTEKAYFRPHHLQLLTPLAAQIAVSIENASLYEGKSRDALTKQVMNEIAKEMTAILELDELLNRIAVLLRRVIAYELLGIFLYDPITERLELKVQIGYASETVETYRSLRLGEGILGHAAKEQRTLLVNDLQNDPRAIQAKCQDGRITRSEAAVPLMSRDRLLGVLVVESCDPGYFTPEHVQILETLASQMSVSIENARLFQQVLAKEQKLEANFALARDLQKGMLPASMPELEGFEVAALYRPAESLGGDYYDFIWLDNALVGLTIGDVSGKGVAAAMSMAATRSAIRFASRIHTSPSQVLYHVNRRLFKDFKERTYVSLFYGVLDLNSKICRWSNGGHFPPILVRADGTREEFSQGGTVLALFDKSRYTSAQTRLNPGDLICFYTDGVIEARNQEDEEFGKERLVQILAEKARQPARDIVKALTGEVKKYTRGVDQHDDITVFVLKVRETA